MKNLPFRIILLFIFLPVFYANAQVTASNSLATFSSVVHAEGVKVFFNGEPLNLTKGIVLKEKGVLRFGIPNETFSEARIYLARANKPIFDERFKPATEINQYDFNTLLNKNARHGDRLLVEFIYLSTIGHPDTHEPVILNIPLVQAAK